MGRNVQLAVTTGLVVVVLLLLRALEHRMPAWALHAHSIPCAGTVLAPQVSSPVGGSHRTLSSSTYSVEWQQRSYIYCEAAARVLQAECIARLVVFTALQTALQLLTLRCLLHVYHAVAQQIAARSVLCLQTVDLFIGPLSYAPQRLTLCQQC
jgi:hypothetical protein